MSWSIRKVELKDSDVIFKWRNDPMVYRYFRNPTPVERTVHELWFKKVVDDAHVFFLIAQHEGQDAGTVRFDLSSDFSRAEISIYLTPELHGKGLSVSLLSEAEKAAKKNFKSLKKIIATVDTENKTSIAMFEKSEYQNKYIQLEKNIGE